MKFVKIAAIIALLLIVVFVLLGLKSQKGKAPGLHDGRLKEPGSAPNVVSSEEGTQPERYTEPLATTMEDAIAAVIATGGTITSKSPDYVSATYMSKVFKFVDDVELRQGDGIVHIRSASRVGYSDQGANAKRVEIIRAAIKK